MVSESELHRLENSIRQLQTELKKLQNEETDIREHELLATRKIRSETERKLAGNSRHVKETTRSIEDLERRLIQKKQEMERQFRLTTGYKPEHK